MHSSLEQSTAAALSSLACVQQWLEAEDTVRQLAALGYNSQDLLQEELSAAAEALNTSSHDLEAAGSAPDGHSAAPAVLQDIQEQLQAAGGVLARFAHRHACNSLACGDTTGPSEAQLVEGHGTKCSGCKTARFCSKACHTAAWTQHKRVCKAVAAAAAATAAGDV